MAGPADALPDDAPHLLVVDDDRRIRDLLSRFLHGEGYRVTTADNAADARAKLGSLSFDLLVLDVMMPGETGFQLAKSLRESSAVPILMLTARAEADSRIQGLELGADDYVSKPFQMEEVLARLRALIRRSSGQASPVLRCGELALDPRSARVTMRGTVIRLTTHEFRVLSYLMHHRGRVVSQGELVEHIYERDADRDSNTVEVFIARLRKKLGAEAIATVRGLGYRIGDA